MKPKPVKLFKKSKRKRRSNDLKTIVDGTVALGFIGVMGSMVK